MYNKCPSLFTVNDSTLHKVVSLTLNKLGTKERTYAMKDDSELGSIFIYFTKFRKKEETHESILKSK